MFSCPDDLVTFIHQSVCDDKVIDQVMDHQNPSNLLCYPVPCRNARASPAHESLIVSVTHIMFPFVDAFHKLQHFLQYQTPSSNNTMLLLCRVTFAFTSTPVYITLNYVTVVMFSINPIIIHYFPFKHIKVSKIEIWCFNAENYGDQKLSDKHLIYNLEKRY